MNYGFRAYLMAAGGLILRVARVIAADQSAGLLGVQSPRSRNEHVVEVDFDRARMGCPIGTARPLVRVRGPRNLGFRVEHPSGKVQGRQVFHTGLLAHVRRSEESLFAQPTLKRLGR